MADRVVAFVKRIQDAPGILPKDLADQIGVSVRTLRKYVRYANERMKGCACIRLVRASGYILEVIDGEAYRDWTNQSDGDASPMPQTPDERVLYIMNNLLVRTDWVRLEDLASDLFVSRTVISTDLKSVKRRLIAFGLMLESRPHYGIRVTGDEMSRRLCLANVVLEMTDDADREEGVAGMVGFGTREEMRVIADCVQDGLNSGGGGVPSQPVFVSEPAHTYCYCNRSCAGWLRISLARGTVRQTLRERCVCRGISYSRFDSRASWRRTIL